jgi:hypothetical protein
MMSAFASGWNVIFSKKALEENNYDLRKVLYIPGTGPFKTQRRVENEIWVMERNPNYWNKGLPYLEGIEFYNLLPFSPELGSPILSGRVDYARALDPATARKAVTTPGLSTAKFYQSVIHATWLNAKRQPFDDPRVRRAMHLLFEKLYRSQQKGEARCSYWTTLQRVNQRHSVVGHRILGGSRVKRCNSTVAALPGDNLSLTRAGLQVLAPPRRALTAELSPQARALTVALRGVGGTFHRDRVCVFLAGRLPSSSPERCRSPF